MKVLDVLNAPWAILPEKKLEIDAIYEVHLRGEKINIPAVEAALGRPLNNQPKGYEITKGGVAVLPVEGVIAKRMNLFSQISGGVSTTSVAQQFQAALADPAVDSIILAIDSPGGSVDGTQELANAIFAARGTKPVIALADGCMCSAAYWIGAAADKIYASCGTAQIGSIGVYMTHVDQSGAHAASGMKKTTIQAGKYKTVGSPNGPLSDEDAAILQSDVDYVYGLFVDFVAQARGVDVETVLSDMAEGRVLRGQQAVDAGLADGVQTLDEIIAALCDPEKKSSITGRAGAVFPGSTSHKADAGGVPAVADSTQNTKGVAMLTPESLKAENPDVYEAIVALGHTEGANAERERIQGCLDAGLPGHEALVQSLAFDGKTTPGDCALACNKAEREKRGKIAQDLKSDAPKPVAGAPVPPVEPKKEETKGAEASKVDTHTLAARIGEYVNAQAAIGNRVSYAAALAHVKAQDAKKTEE